MKAKIRLEHKNIAVPLNGGEPPVVMGPYTGEIEIPDSFWRNLWAGLAVFSLKWKQNETDEEIVKMSFDIANTFLAEMKKRDDV